MELLETKQQFIELRAKGWSFDKIAKELGKAKQTLIVDRQHKVDISVTKQSYT